MAQEIKNPRTSNNGRLVGGLILIVVGLLFLLENFFPGLNLGFSRLWPLIIIAIGLALMIKS